MPMMEMGTVPMLKTAILKEVEVVPFFQNGMLVGMFV